MYKVACTSDLTAKLTILWIFNVSSQKCNLACIGQGSVSRIILDVHVLMVGCSPHAVGSAWGEHAKSTQKDPVLARNPTQGPSSCEATALRTERSWLKTMHCAVRTIRFLIWYLHQVAPWQK